MDEGGEVERWGSVELEVIVDDLVGTLGAHALGGELIFWDIVLSKTSSVNAPRGTDAFLGGVLAMLGILALGDELVCVNCEGEGIQ